MLIILISAPVVILAVLMYSQARDYSIKLNRRDRAIERERNRQRTGRYY
ncbi:MAG: hypothetical protein MJ127_01065 [Mogibacterium sp.]|nr:hypothetical protein [Mogibacterium sp.]